MRTDRALHNSRRRNALAAHQGVFTQFCEARVGGVGEMEGRWRLGKTFTHDPPRARPRVHSRAG